MSAPTAPSEELGLRDGAGPRELLRPVLARLRAGVAVGALAADLGLDPRLVDAAVAQLVRLGLAQVAGPRPTRPGAAPALGCATGTGGAGCAPPPAAGARRRIPLACAGCPLASASPRRG
ncbi:hypothetical protein [Oerskovia enterophila]|uniref:hypothetical protein n=1 Tax=Oerskovia enterophila TaxID=43678 RepID=UPI0033996464